MSSEGRTEIVNQISQVHLQPSQNLRQFSLPDSVYDLARNFVSRMAIMEEKNGKKHCRYYTVLNYIEGGGIYALLEQAAKHSTLEQVSEVIAQWQEALKALLRYALNLLLAPNRPELRTVKLYNSFFVYQVANKLKGAEKILLALGYSLHHSSSSSTLSLNESQELVYNGEVNIDHVAETATDLVILLCDLEQLQAYVMDRKSLDLHRSPVQDILAGVLKVWRFDSWSVLTSDAVSVASSSQGNYDPRVSSQFPPNVQGANYHSRNLDYLNVQTWGEDLDKDQVPSDSQSREYEHRGINRHPLLEACQSLPKHGFHWETSANILTEGLSPVDDSLRHPVDYSDRNLSSTSADFLSFLQNIPRPNIEDFPEPIYNNEFEFSLEKSSFFVNSFNSNQHVVNLRSNQDAYDNSLIGRNFSLEEHTSANCRERTDSSTEEVLEEVLTVIETYSHGAAEEISTSTKNNQSLSSRHRRSHSYDPGMLANCHTLPFNSNVCENSPLVAGAVNRSDGDITRSYVILSPTESSIKTDSLNNRNHQVYQSNSNQVSSFVKSKERTGDGFDNPSPEILPTKVKSDKKGMEKIVYCETEHTEDGFVVVDRCSNSHSKCSETRTSGAMYSDEKALEKVEWMTGNTIPASTWTCPFCTNINAKEFLFCEICDVKNSN